MSISFEKKAKSLFLRLKKRTTPLKINIRNGSNEIIGELVFITEALSKEKIIINKLSKWRKKFYWAFPSQFKVTNEGTAKWLKSQLIDKEDRILFMVVDNNKKFIGHVGLYSFDFVKETCEIDNVVRGETSTPGIMTFALSELIKWTFKNVEIKKLYLRVFSDNSKAIELYKRCGFKENELIPLIKKIQGETLFWVEPGRDEKKRKYDKFFLKMIWSKNYVD